jgi:hypothetical protein
MKFVATKTGAEAETAKPAVRFLNLFSRRSCGLWIPPR